MATLIDPQIKSSKDAESIRRWLFSRLKEQADKQFGRIPAPAVRVQIEQARLRLARFSELQALRASQGWEIWATEIDVTREMNVSMTVDGFDVTFHGRIDRIDYHPESHCFAVWDYKTSDTPKKPLKAHFHNDQWSQLQLPLYRRMVRGLGIEKLISVGYINLPKAIDQTAFEIAEFSDELLELADQKTLKLSARFVEGFFGHRVTMMSTRRMTG